MNETEEFLEHYGVKGMRWGVRKDYEYSNVNKLPAGKDAEKLTPLEMDVVNKLAPAGYSPEKMRRMYGPESEKSKTSNQPVKATVSNKQNAGKEDFELTPLQKELLKKAAIYGGAALAIYGLNKYGQHKINEYYLGKDAPKNLKDFWKTSQKIKGAQAKGFSKDFIDNLSTEPITIKAGSLVTRISSMKESYIREGGFYAANDPKDIARYKAVLPVYWKLWGVNNADGGGYIVNIKAKTDVRAPSPKETYDLFKKYVLEDTESRELSRIRRNPKNLDASLRKALPELVLRWNDRDDPVTAGFFTMLQNSGYNAVVDFNDAGSLGHRPLRILDSDLFEIANVKRLTPAAIKNAQEKVNQLAHAILEFVNNKLGIDMNETEEFLEHFGVKGMRWGVRKAPDRLSINKTDTKITKEVKKDYNNSTNKEFRRKYAASKKTYAKRVEKYGDPYKQRRDGSGGKVTDSKTRAELEKINAPKTTKPKKTIAQRMDTGNDIVNTALWGPVGSMVLAKARNSSEPSNSKKSNKSDEPKTNSTKKTIAQRMDTGNDITNTLLWGPVGGMVLAKARNS